VRSIFVGAVLAMATTSAAGGPQFDQTRFARHVPSALD